MGRPKGSTKYDHEHIVQLFDRGVSRAAIAKRLGCSKSSVDRAINESEKKEEEVVKV